MDKSAITQQVLARRADDFASAVTLHVAQSWSLERDRLYAELADVRTKLNTLAAYMEGAEQTPATADADIRNELAMLNDRMERLTQTVAGLMADAGQHSVRA